MRRENRTDGAVFLDRDGTLNPDPGYIASLNEFKFYKGAMDALATLSLEGFRFVVVTNQSGVGRGVISPSGLQDIHDYLKISFRDHGIELLGIYYCPHTPQAACDCRKPGTELFRRAAAEHSIELDASYVIGDSVRDMEAGRALGMTTVLVRTGNGKSTESSLREKGMVVDFVGDDLEDCSKFILTKERGR